MNNHEDYKYRRYKARNYETRWATLEEIKNSATRIDLADEDYSTAGLPVISNGETAYVDGSDTHSIIFGATGSKKTRLFCLPIINMMIRAGESFIATDPKGELYKSTSGAAKAKGYKTVVLNLRDFEKGDCWNPLSIPYELYHSGERDEATSLLADLMTTLADPKRVTAADPFWESMSKSLGLANLLMLMEYAKKEEVHMGSFVNMCTDRFILALKDKLSMLDNDSVASMNYRSTLSGSPATTQNVVASLSSCVNIFVAQRKLLKLLSTSTFDIRRFGHEKTAVYLIIPDEKTTLHFLVTTFIKQAYELLIKEAQNEPTLELPVRVNFVLDEFCNIPKIPDMPSMISAARSRNMRYFLVVQSKHQLISKYGEDADTIKGNCDNWVFLTSKELSLLNELSELCGTYRAPDGMRHCLISVSELQRLSKERGEALIIHSREYPIISELADIDEYKMFNLIAPAPLPTVSVGALRVFEPNYYIEAFDIANRVNYARMFSTTDKELIELLDEYVKENAICSEDITMLNYFGVSIHGGSIKQNFAKKDKIYKEY